MKPCPLCRGEATLKAWHHGYLVTCERCYDPTPYESGDAGGALSGFGITRAGAIIDWNEHVEEA